MSAYDDAVAYLDAEVHPRCDYDIYSDMRDIVDEMESENAKLRELVRIMHGELVACEDNGYVCGGHKFDNRVRELGVEVDE